MPDGSHRSFLHGRLSESLKRYQFTPEKVNRALTHFVPRHSQLCPAAHPRFAYRGEDVVQTLEIRACIPGRKQRKTTVRYDRRRYKRRNRIEIMFGRLKDWRRLVTRYDRCPKVFLSAIALAATVIYWL